MFDSSRTIFFLGHLGPCGRRGVASEEPLGPGMAIPGPNNNRRPHSEGGSKRIHSGHDSTKGPGGGWSVLVGYDTALKAGRRGNKFVVWL